MIEPTFDRDSYPTDYTLERIKTWPVETFADMHAAMDFAGRAWSYPDRWERIDEPDPDHFDRTGLPRFIVRYVFSTGGWSGNESIVGAIEANQTLQMIGAWAWQRGGHYEYRFPVDSPPKEAE